MCKDFSDFKKYLSEHGSEIDAEVAQKSLAYSGGNKADRIRAESHFEMLAVLERYHDWLNH